MERPVLGCAVTVSYYVGMYLEVCQSSDVIVLVDQFSYV